VIGKRQKLQNGSFNVWLETAFAAACFAMQPGTLREIGYLFVQIEVNLLHLLDQLLYAQSVFK
jgi:hypothetical protein